MMIDLPLMMIAALTAIVLCGALVQTVTGFGLNVVALSLGALLMPIPVWLPVIVTINLPLTAWICWRDKHAIAWPLLLRRVLPWMFIGGVAGFLIASQLGGEGLKRLYGVVVVLIALRELFVVLAQRPPGQATRPTPWILSAGVAQGMYASGGPFLVHALAGQKLPRAEFRATLMAVWLTMNTLLVLGFALTGQWQFQTGALSAWVLPGVFAGMWLGECLHHRLPERGFKLCVQTTLLAAGIALIV